MAGKTYTNDDRADRAGGGPGRSRRGLLAAAAGRWVSSLAPAPTDNTALPALVHSAPGSAS